MKKGIFQKAALGLGALTLAGIVSCSKPKPEKEVLPQVPEFTESPTQEFTYTVKRGDYLSGIVYDELKLRGRAIYDKCLEIQQRNNFGPERDVYQMVNGELVPGKDGFTDLIYPDEKIVLYDY